MQVSSLEQSMACGEDAVGRTYKSALADLKGFLASSDGQLLSPGDARAHAPSQRPLPPATGPNLGGISVGWRRRDDTQFRFIAE